ncbi:hypothetical protein [Desulfovibrio sp. JC010]|uniref:TIGR03943 family putative permease subunit n=1 Tax=Desulfovibrio sp. JC010 TaxID=2593641 RepID=UPI0013D0EB01|nr:hypothetical protein [Desulfovibrio sp. JC010]NDV25275.1 hypothetical protein [Desulfovibrio sp. JC010]
MAGLLRFLESLLLVGTGTFMVVLSCSSYYWQFLNPKYSWLTFVTGVVLSVVGGVCLFNWERQRKISELLGIVVFLGLAYTAVVSFEYMGEDDYGLAESGGLTGEFHAEIKPAVDYGGVEYTKINLAEMLAVEEFVSAGDAYAVQGLVLRTPELDRAGFIGVGRLFITCCFADSTAVVCLVKVDTPDQFKEGAWVRVLGTLEKGVPALEKSLTIKGALNAVRSDTFVLKAVEVEEHPVEGMPFIFDVKTEPPFEY